MKRLPKELTARFRPVRLGRSDIQRLHDAFARANAEVLIHCNDWQLETLDDLNEWSHGEITALGIKVRDPYISLTLGPTGSHLYASDDSPMQRGVFEEVKQMLEPQQIAFTGKLFGFVPGFFFGPSIVFLWYDPNPNEVIAASLGIVAGGLVVLRDFHYSFKKGLEVQLSEATSFVSRNKDQIILAAIAAVFGSLATLALQWFTK